MTHQFHRSLSRCYCSLREMLAVLVHSNVFISAAAASVAVTTMLLADLGLRPGPPFIVFAVTMFVYSANSLLDLAADERNVPTRTAFTRRYGRCCLAVGIALYLAAVALALALEVPGVWALAIPVVVTVLYSWVGLQRVLLVKNLLVGVSWGLIPVGVGVYTGSPWHPVIWFLFGWVTCVLTVAAAVFDIKDIDGDRAAGIRTVPIRYGPKTTRRLAQAANVALALAVVGAVVAGVVAPVFCSLLALHCYVGAYIPFATPEREPLFYGFVVDGEHLVLLLVVATVRALGPALGS
jgi:4-hydroxybenzoate polyprenyltransferase